MKIIVTGGNGLLGTEIKKYFSTNSKTYTNTIVKYYGRELDVTNANALFLILNKEMPDIIIHCAAITDSKYVDFNRDESIHVNIIGTANVAMWCAANKRRMVYISTDYVYDGTMKNLHREDESVKPENLYATTKLGGECAAILVPNHLIIRTSFGKSECPYEYAYDDIIVSKDYVDVITPMIMNASISSVCGVLNIGTEPKSIYEYALKRNSKIKKSISKKVSYNFGLNVEKYNEKFNINI